MEQRRSWRDLLLSILVPGLLLAIGLLTVRFSYEVNDDTAMISIMNGSFTGTPSGHAMFIMYPLSRFISLLYGLAPGLSWYQIVMFGIIWLASSSVLYRLLKRIPEHPVLACAIVAGSISVLWMVNIMRFTYSTCGAYVAAATMVCYGLQKKEEDLKPGYLVNILLLYVLSYFVRDYYCYVTTCFLAALWLVKYGKEMFSKTKGWLIPIAAVAVMGLSIVASELPYQEWDWFWDYNTARSDLQDFIGFPNYWDNEEMISSLGYDNREYYAISHYDYCLLEEYDPNDLFALSEYAWDLQPEVGLVRMFKNTIKQTLDYFFVDNVKDLHMLQLASYILPILLLILSVWKSVREKKWHILGTLIILFGIAGIWFVIAWQGRYPSRIASSMRILTIGASLAGIAQLAVLKSETEPGSHEAARETKPLSRLLSGALAGLFLLAGIWGLADARNRLGAPAGEVEAAAYVTYAAEHPENIYLRDTRSASKHVTLLSEFPRTPTNVIATGSWTAYSPLFYEKLEALGLEELNRDTLFLDNCYLIVAEKYNLCEVLGVQDSAVIDYEIVETFDDGMRILKIHSVTERE